MDSMDIMENVFGIVETASISRDRRLVSMLIEVIKLLVLFA